MNSTFPAPEVFYDAENAQTRIPNVSRDARGDRFVYLSPVRVERCCLRCGALLAFYAQPSQFITATIVCSTWSRPGFRCEPAQNDAYYKVKYTHDECLANIREPNTATV